MENILRTYSLTNGRCKMGGVLKRTARLCIGNCIRPAMCSQDSRVLVSNDCVCSHSIPLRISFHLCCYTTSQVISPFVVHLKMIKSKPPKFKTHARHTHRHDHPTIDSTPPRGCRRTPELTTLRQLTTVLLNLCPSPRPAHESAEHQWIHQNKGGVH